MAHRLPRLAAAVLLALTSTACPDDSVPTTPMPGGLDLAGLLPAQRALVRATLEISGGALAETELDLDDDLQTLSGTFDVQNVTAPTDRELQLRVYGRFADDSEEVLLGRLLKPITLQPEADVAIAFSADDTFDSCGGEPGACAVLFDANRNGVSNLDDLLERDRSGGLGIDPAPQAPYLVTSSEQLQFPSGVRLGSFARQLVVLENFGDNQVEITSAAVVGGQGFAISILDPTGQSVAPPGRSLAGDTFQGIAPGQEAFITVSFTPVNSFVTTGALFVRVRDTVTLVEQTARVKLIANPEGELRPADLTYTEPALDAITVEGGELQLTAFPNAQLQSGDALIAEDALGAGLRQTGASVELVDGDVTVDFPADAAFSVTVRAGERFSTALDGLTSDIDIAVVDITDGAVAGLACADCRSANAGTSPEAVEFKNDTSTSRTVAVLIGRIEPEVGLPETEGGLSVAETVSFRCSTTLSIGPEFAEVDPIQPTTGPLEGGVPVRLRGSGFDPRARVFVGQAEALDVAIETDADGVDVVTFTLPAAVGTENPASVIVENPKDPGDGQAATLLESFTYQPPAPVIDEIRPDLAPTTGGDTTVTIVGRFFSARHGAPLVTFGTVTVPATFVSASELTLTAPPHVDVDTAATVSVKVRNRIAADVDGAPVLGSASNGVAFRYLVPAGAPPTIVAVNPAVGSVDGGTRVSVEGTDIRPGVRVFFGGREASCDTPTSTTVVSCVTPAADEPVAVDVIVVNADAQSAKRDAGYRYEIPAPSITSIFPPRGITDGGTFLVVEGGGFRPGARVTFVQGDTFRDATAATRVSGTTMLVTTPPGTAGAADLIIRNLDGQSVTGAFTYFAPDQATPPPSITALSPAVGDAAGGYPVVITGTGFLSPSVLFGSQNVTAAFVDRTPPELDELTVTAPPSPTGVAAAVTVQVINDDGQSATSGFNYTFSAAAPPRIDRIAPSTFVSGQTTAFTISGARFDAGAIVLVGGLQAAITARSSSSISATIGGQLPLGAVQVVVENPNGSAVSIPVQVVTAGGNVQPAITAISTSDIHADVAGDVITLFGAGLDQGTASVQVAAANQADPARPARVLVQNPNFLVVELPAIPPGRRVLQASFDTAAGTRTALSPTVTAQPPVIVLADGDTLQDGRLEIAMFGDFFHPAALEAIRLDGVAPIDCIVAVATERAIRCTTASPLQAGTAYELALSWIGSFNGTAQLPLRRTGPELGFRESISGPPLEIVDVSAPIRGLTDFAVVNQTITLEVPGIDPAQLPVGAAVEVIVGNRGQQPGQPDVFAARGDAIVDIDTVTTTLDLGILQFAGITNLPVSVTVNGADLAFGFVEGVPRNILAGNVSIGWSQELRAAFNDGLAGDENRVVAVRQADQRIVVPLTATLAGIDLTIADTRALAPGQWLACLADQVSVCATTGGASFFIFGLGEEQEPNDTPQTANGVAAFGSVNGVVNSPNVDHYFFRLDGGEPAYRVAIAGGCVGGMSVQLSLRATGVIITDVCQNEAPVALTPDEYVVTVNSAFSEPVPYQLVLGSGGGGGGCGNGIVESGEQCDEGGSFIANCNAACQENFEDVDGLDGFVVGAVPVFAERTLAIGDTDRFTFTVGTSGPHAVSVTPRNAEGCGFALAAVFLDGPTGFQSLPLDRFGCMATSVDLVPGTYRLEVQGSSEPLKYRVEVQVGPPNLCAGGSPNLVIEPGEACDEGPGGGFGCSPGCDEFFESNEGITPVGQPNIFVERTLVPGDTDVIGVAIPTAGDYRVFLINRELASCEGRLDNVLVSGAGVDQSLTVGPGCVDQIVSLQVGTLNIALLSGAQPLRYGVGVDFVGATPVCGNGALEGPELCDDGDLAAGDGCSPACFVEAGFNCFGSPSVCELVRPDCGNGIIDPGETCDEGPITGSPIPVGSSNQIVCNADCFEPPTIDLQLGPPPVNVARTLTAADSEVITIDVPVRSELNIFSTFRDAGSGAGIASCGGSIKLTIRDAGFKPLTTSVDGNGGCAFAQVVVPPGRFFVQVEAASPGESFRFVVGAFTEPAPPGDVCGDGIEFGAPSGAPSRTVLLTPAQIFGGLTAGVAVDNNDVAYFIENAQAPRRVRRRNPDGTNLFLAFGAIGSGADIEVGPDGFIYVADGGGFLSNGATPTNTVVRINPASGVASTFVASVANPSGLAFGPDGMLYVAEFDSRTIRRFDASSGTPIDTFQNNLPVRPSDIEFGPDGHLYVAGFDPTTFSPQTVVFEISPTGVLSPFVDTGLADPHSLAFDAGGNLWISVYNGNTIVGVTASGEPLASLPEVGPNGIAIGRDGALYAMLVTGDFIRHTNTAFVGPEQCDDGGPTNGDGCSPGCRIEGDIPFAPIADSGLAGGAGGGAVRDLCDAGSVLVGLHGRAGVLVGAVGGVCAKTRIAGASVELVGTYRLPLRGIGGGTPFEILCPPDQAVVAFSGNAGGLLDAIELSCAGMFNEAGITVDGVTEQTARVGGAGGVPFGPIACGPNAVATGIAPRVGDNVDAFGMTCGTPQ